MMLHKHRAHAAFTLIELLAVIAIIGVLVGLLLPAVQAARESARRSACTSTLRQWTIAILNHHEVKGAFPYIANRKAAGGTEDVNEVSTAYRPWVVAVWPYIEQADLSDRWNFSRPHNDTGATPIGGMRNNTIAQRLLPINYCPSDRPGAFLCIRGGQLGTNTGNCGARQNYTVNGGTGSWLQPRPTAPFGFSGGTVQSNFVPFCTKLKNIVDGSSKTLLMGELRSFPSNEGVFAANVLGATMSANADADGRGFLWTGVGGIAFSTFATPNSGVDVSYGNGCRADFDPEGLPCQNAPGGLNTPHAARSRHPGGVNVSMCDGAVRFVENGISLTTWQELSTRQSGKVPGDY